MSISLLSDWFTTLSLVFGGCCSNAITLEQLTSEYPQAGSLITFLQFLIVSIYGLPIHTTWTSYGPRLKPRRIPMPPYIAQVVLFYLISLLNNAAFAYRIPMAVHIIFRSGGLVVSMFLGWLVVGKRYSTTQIFSVLLVTFGVVLTTLSASAPAKTSESSANLYTYATGIAILTLGLFFSGFLGLMQDWTYSRYGRPTTPSSEVPVEKQLVHQTPAWQESMFYLHFLALPMFFSVRSNLMAQIAAVNASPRVAFPLRLPPFISSSPNHSLFVPPSSMPEFTIPLAYIPLLFNTLTQLLCVAGVHRLTTRVNALSVTLVLVVRKAASLVISVASVGLIGARKSNGAEVDTNLMWIGAGMVLVGTITYSVGSGRASPKVKGKEE